MFHLDKHFKDMYNIELYRLWDFSNLKEDSFETVDPYIINEVKLCECNNVQYIIGSTANASDDHWRGYKLINSYNDENLFELYNFHESNGNI